MNKNPVNIATYLQLHMAGTSRYTFLHTRGENKHTYIHPLLWSLHLLYLLMYYYEKKRTDTSTRPIPT